MSLPGFVTRTWLSRLALIALAVTALYWYVESVREKIRADSFAGVGLTGVHHLGPNFNVAEFYIDGYHGGNVGREGGGGGSTCCVLLPKRWRPGLAVEVRWSLNDWSDEKPAETEAGNFDSVASGGGFIALVPVEKYAVAEHVWVHFYPGGKARVVSSMPGSGGPKHPIQDDDPHAIKTATAGRRVNALFSAKELAEFKRKDEASKRTNGDWR